MSRTDMAKSRSGSVIFLILKKYMHFHKHCNEAGIIHQHARKIGLFVVNIYKKGRNASWSKHIL